MSAVFPNLKEGRRHAGLRPALGRALVLALALALTMASVVTPLSVHAQNPPSRANLPDPNGGAPNNGNGRLGTTPAFPADPNAPGGGVDPSQMQPQQGDIRDIRGVISIPYGWLWLAYFTAVLILFTLCYEGWRLYDWYRNKRKRPPHEVALAALEKARALMRPETVKEYSVAVSEAVRVYIEARFGLLGLVAARRTTEEFLQKVLTLKNTPVAMHASGLEHFLQTCDMVKFARQELTVREMEDMLSSARNFVNETKAMPNELEKPKPEAGADGALPKFGDVADRHARAVPDRSRGDEAYMPPGSFVPQAAGAVSPAPGIGFGYPQGTGQTHGQGHAPQQLQPQQLPRQFPKRQDLPPGASAPVPGPTFSNDIPRSS